MKPTPEQIELMRHARGADKGWDRNHFATTDDSPDDILWGELVSGGLAEGPATKPQIYGDMKFYRVTEAGDAVIKEPNP